MKTGQHQQQQLQHHSWKLNVQAKAKNLDFKLVASNFLPNFKFFPFSFKFKYCRFLIHFQSQSHFSSNHQKPKSFKSRLHRFLEKLRFRRSKKRKATIFNTNSKAKISESSVVIGNIALFIQSIYQRDKDGIIILGSIVFLYFAYLFKNFIARKAWKLFVFVIGALVFGSNVMHLRFSSHFDHHYVSSFLWRAFKNAASSGCLYLLSQVLTAVSRVI